MDIFVDSHTHLYQQRFDEDIDEVIQRSLAAGVTTMILPNIDLESLEKVADLSHRYLSHCLPTVGLHPCDVKEDYEAVLEEMKKWAFEPTAFPDSRIYAIGETGLDYYWDETYIEQQKAALNIQLEWCRQLDLPVILHTRESVQDTIDIIAKEHKGILRGVFHCFSGTLEEARQIIAMDNFYLGVGGPVTYKNAALPELLREIPLERILLETDAPYLPPVPYRGKRNESSFIPLIAEKLAEIKRCSLSEMARQTTANAGRLFGFRAHLSI